MLFGHKPKPPQVDLGDLDNEKEQLALFIESKLKLKVAENQNKLLVVTSDKLPPKELQHVVTKFLYRRNLNNTYYVSLEGNTVKVNTFKNVSKKHKKTKKEASHQTAVQSWGL
ncbi:MAG: hypothetical protein NWF05_09655 [Candidatus Bathyarchaeota archaeon]|nr:hypothetical protein [Candidatus Bathyarchaeota archaeon]